MFIYFGRHWVSVAACRLSLVVESGGHSVCSIWASNRSGSSCGAQAPERMDSVVVARGLSSCGTWAQ